MSGMLAINGGKPVRETYLPYGKQWVDDKDIEAVTRVLRSDYLTTGPEVNKFEKLMAEYLGVKYAVAISNGTAALHAACFAAGIQHGDEVLVSPMTFAASSNSVLYCGGKPVFVDVDFQTMNIDPSKIVALITDNTKAIIAVDFTGAPCDYEKIIKIAKQNDLILIEDAAHALGANYGDRKIGNLADLTTFSFHPVKHITTGEGGLITTNDPELWRKLLLFRNHGIKRDKEQLINNHGAWYYEQHTLGYNYRITDIQCVLGTSQLSRLDGFLEMRRDIVRKYNNAFRDMPTITIPSYDDVNLSAWHLYVIRLKLDELVVGRAEIYNALLAENIGVNVHYIPVYYHPYYRKLGYKKGICPVAEQTYEELISLPLFPKMNDKDVEDVIGAVNKVVDHYRK